MEKPAHEETRHGLTIKIFQDTDPTSPREWDNLGKMVCFHGRYKLGDEHRMSPEDARALAERADVIALPLFLYDHSGITMNTSGFSCPWDSGQVGIIFVDYATIRKEYNVKKVGKAIRRKVIALLESEVKTYDDYLTGNVYGYRIEDAAGEEVDSCWGFFGEDTSKTKGVLRGETVLWALKEARESVDRMTHNGTTDHHGQRLLKLA